MASIPKNHFSWNRDFRRIAKADRGFGEWENTRKLRNSEVEVGDVGRTSCG
jgi:hypothetical protein